ncbi:arsenate reductase [Leeuwenhoekiella polynyae]|uniref:Arsenate reductase n=2 Tax=Leeuwenhoekiella polynyae TaxID=1550906 RepID=A0A4Q0P9C8_9FLAO|nr:arsenate reductase [Leeuwenhoekiella polynyae]|tara:strand:- start:125 stop:430 length:306 start_codon:yes stop_codon:yes gene_type:complete
MDEIELPSAFIKQDIKTDPITEEQLDQLYNLSNSYEALFNKRARLYRERGLNNENLSEDDFEELILEQYTFLKRPVIVNNDQIFIGNSKKTVAAAKEAIHS